MQNQEILLTNYSLIHEMLNARFSLRQILEELNTSLEAQITYRQLRYIIDRVRKGTIHSEYDNIIMIDILRDFKHKNLSNYCIEFHGLWITYKSAAHLTSPEYIITPDNILTIYNKEALLYAKRILKLYHIPDIVLLEQHQQNYPTRPDIDLDDFTYKIRVEFDKEFNTMLSNLRKKYVYFLTNNLKEQVNAKKKTSI